MYKLEGELINCFRVPASDKYPESYKVQVLGETTTQAGETRKEMLTLSVSSAQWEALKTRVGRPVSVPIGIFVKGGVMHAYVPKDAPTASMVAHPAALVKPGVAAS